MGQRKKPKPCHYRVTVAILKVVPHTVRAISKLNTEGNKFYKKKIIITQPFSKQINLQITIASLLGELSTSSQSCHKILSKTSQQKSNETCKETGKHNQYTRKETNKRNCLSQ